MTTLRLPEVHMAPVSYSGAERRALRNGYTRSRMDVTVVRKKNAPSLKKETVAFSWKAAFAALQ